MLYMKVKMINSKSSYHKKKFFSISLIFYKMMGGH